MLVPIRSAPPLDAGKGKVVRSGKGAAQVKPPNGLIEGDLVPCNSVSTHECVCSGVIVLMLE